mgnify:CR=1 FL=1
MLRRILILVTTLFCVSCDNEINVDKEPQEKDITHDDIPHDIEQYIIQYHEAEIINPIAYVDGNVAYYIFRYKNESGFYVKRAYYVGIGEMSINDADNLYNTNHRHLFGSIDIGSYSNIKSRSLDEVYRANIYLSNQEELNKSEQKTTIFNLCSTFDIDCELIGSSTTEVIEIKMINGSKALELSKKLPLGSILYATYIGDESSNSRGDQSLVNTPQQSASGYNASFQRSNQQGIYGDAIKVGLMEQLTGGCGIFEGHESLKYLSDVHYLGEELTSIPLKSCDLNASASDQAKQCGANEPCVLSSSVGIACVPDENGNGYCAGQHASMVASRIASSMGAPFNAAKIDLYVANFYNSARGGIQWGRRYEWFAENEIKIVNESITSYESRTGYGPASEGLNDVILPDEKARITDEYSRKNKILFIQAAGNLWPAGNGEFHNSYDVFCTASNSICVGSVDANETYFDVGNILSYYDDIYQLARWKNPIDPLIPPVNGEYTRKDQEKPDLVSEGERALVMGFDPRGNEWQRLGGTSFATPVVTATAANHLQEYNSCPLKIGEDTLLLRSSLRNLAYQPQKINKDFGASPSEFYPVPGESNDSVAGVGITIDAFDLCLYTNNEPSPVSEKGMEGSDGIFKEITRGGADGSEEDLSSGWEPVPEESSGSLNENETTDISLVYNLKLGNKPNSSGKVVRKPLMKENAFGLDFDPDKDQIELRASLSFYSCPDASKLTVRPHVDYDLIVCTDEEKEVCFAGSQSIHDTNEGFHVVIPPEHHYKNITYYIVKDEAAVDPCPGYNTEPYYFTADKFIKTVVFN